jgi:hypothetical protein
VDKYYSFESEAAIIPKDSLQMEEATPLIP